MQARMFAEGVGFSCIFFSNTLRLLLVLWWEWEGKRKVSKTKRGEVLRVFPNSVFVSFAFFIMN